MPSTNGSTRTGGSPTAIASSPRPTCACWTSTARWPSSRGRSIENGAGWAYNVLKKVDLAAAQTPGWFKEKPSETFRRHVWVSPFWEENPARSAEFLGYDRTLFGSDWPHIEGIPEPIEYVDSL